MPLLTPDPTFYPSPAMATQSPPEKLAYLALINPLKDGRPDAIGVVDVDPQSGAAFDRASYRGHACAMS
jgi:methanethiol oxidase